MKKLISVIAVVGILLSCTAAFADGGNPPVKERGPIVTNYDPGTGGGG